MYFRLNPECYFIQGSARGAIFDLIDSRIYALSPEETELIESSEKNQPVSNHEKFLQELKELRLGTFYNNKMYMYKVRVINSSMEEELKFQTNLSRAFLEINNSCQRDCWFCGSHGVSRSMGCMGCNKWNEDGRPLEVERWKGLVDELRDLDCKDIIITGGDLTLAWDRTMKILDYAEGKFSKIYMVLHQDSLSKVHLGDLDGRARPIIQIENFSNAIAKDGSIPLLIVKPEHYGDIWNSIPEKKDVFLDFVIKDRQLSNDLPIMSHKKIKMPNIYQFSHHMRYHPCIGGTLAISHTGNVLPCPMMRGHSLGNIRDKELFTIFERGLNEINKFWKLTLDKIDKCRYCEFRYSCIDCRALDESLTGRLEDKKVCSYDPKEGAWA